MSSLFRAALCVALLAAGPAPAQDARPHFLPPDAIDIAALLPPPPATDSSITKAELAEVLRLQTAATPAEKAQAVSDAKESVFFFADVLGPNFTADKLPITLTFLQSVQKAEGEFVNPAKKIFGRPRPPLVDPAIKSCETSMSASPSYPSGHATFGWLEGIVLARMVPEKSAEIFARAAMFAHNRLVCGVHYPSDIEAGRISGTVIAAMLMDNPTFRAEFPPARDELRKALDLPPRPAEQ
jgi:acid phosphatase (class A)